MENFLHYPWWIWLLIGVIPYSIEQQKKPNMQSLALSALSWQFTLKYQKKQYSWSFSLPWIKQIRYARYLRTIFFSVWTKLVQEEMKKVTTLWK